MGNIDQLTVVSTDGASQLTKNVAGGFAEIDAVLKSTTGIDLRGLLGSFAGGAAAGAAAARAASTAKAPVEERTVVGEPVPEPPVTLQPAANPAVTDED